MKKFFSAILTLALLASLAGCSLFADDSSVKLGDSYTHKDPKDLRYDTRIVLQAAHFNVHLEDFMNAAAYPDTRMYDDSGNMIGIYDYNEETGRSDDRSIHRLPRRGGGRPGQARRRPDDRNSRRCDALFRRLRREG